MTQQISCLNPLTSLLNCLWTAVVLIQTSKVNLETSMPIITCCTIAFSGPSTPNIPSSHASSETGNGTDAANRTDTLRNVLVLPFPFRKLIFLRMQTKGETLPESAKRLLNLEETKKI